MNFSKLTAYLDHLTSECGIPGCDMTVWQDHTCLFRHMSGEARPGEPVKGNELYRLYSSSKPLTMVCVLQLIEAGKIALTDPVSKYLPSFSAQPPITIEELMSMQSGLNYDLEETHILEALKRFGANATTQQMVEAIGKRTLDFEPGTHFRYSLSHDVLGAVIEVVSGQSFEEYEREHIWKPLGMKDMTFHVTDVNRDRLAERYRWDDTDHAVRIGNNGNPYVFSDSYESGGAGLVGSVDDYILFADALACGGIGASGQTILSVPSIDKMRTPRLGPASLRDFRRDCANSVGYSYGLGVRTRVECPNGLGTIGEFGWDGAAGAYVLIDPEKHLSIFYAQHVLACGLFYSDYQYQLRDLTYEALKIA